MSRACVLQADSGAEQLVRHYADDEPAQVWRAVAGKAAYGQPATLSQAEFVHFMATPEGKAWLRDLNGLYASYFTGILAHCENARATGANWQAGR